MSYPADSLSQSAAISWLQRLAADVASDFVRFQRNCFEGSLEQHAADIETAVAAMGADLAPPVIWARVYLSAIHLASPSAGLLGGMPHCTGPGPGPGQL